MTNVKNLVRFAVFAILATGITANSMHALFAKSNAGSPDIVVKCENDLAKHLGIPVSDIAVAECQPKEWADTSLGLPERGKMYAQVITPGYRVILEAKHSRYLYTASQKFFRFGGPVALWEKSALYVEPVMDEPNLNGNLYQCSLIGTNDTLITSGVTEFYPQDNEALLYTQRLSRHEEALFFVKAGKATKPTLLYNAFAFGAAALNAKQDKWAGFIKPDLGEDWVLTIKSIKGKDETKLPVPETIFPRSIVWTGSRIMIMGDKNEKKFYFEIAPSSVKPEWKSIPAYEYPGAMDYVLNKSETLEVVQTGSSIEIVRVWFTGDRKIMANLIDTNLKGHQLLGDGYLFVWGEKNGETASYTVNIATGEVVAGFHGSCLAIRPFLFAPIHKP